MLTKKYCAILNNLMNFQLGNKIFKHVIWIPIGPDPTSLFANLFLYDYESKEIKKNKKDLNKNNEKTCK